MVSRRRKYYKDQRFMKIIGANIRIHRKQKKITLQELAFACNDIDYAYINKIELGQINLSISYLKLIADKLHVPLEKLLSENQ